MSYWWQNWIFQDIVFEDGLIQVGSSKPFRNQMTALRKQEITLNQVTGAVPEIMLVNSLDQIDVLVILDYPIKTA